MLRKLDKTGGFGMIHVESQIRTRMMYTAYCRFCLHFRSLKLKNSWEKLKNIWNSFISALKIYWKKFVDFLSKIKDKIVEVFDSGINSVLNYFELGVSVKVNTTVRLL